MAQLGARLTGSQEVRGSIPLGSTSNKKARTAGFFIAPVSKKGSNPKGHAKVFLLISKAPQSLL